MSQHLSGCIIRSLPFGFVDPGYEDVQEASIIVIKMGLLLKSMKLLDGFLRNIARITCRSVQLSGLP
jgi:hypothetical protein